VPKTIIAIEMYTRVYKLINAQNINA